MRGYESTRTRAAGVVLNSIFAFRIVAQDTNSACLKPCTGAPAIPERAKACSNHPRGYQGSYHVQSGLDAVRKQARGEGKLPTLHLRSNTMLCIISSPVFKFQHLLIQGALKAVCSKGGPAKAFALQAFPNQRWVNTQGL
eukprot:3007914-Karenia_brevis.AAC.1